MTQYDDEQRGTGRTKAQMMEAPEGAIFIWCNGHTDYPKRLAKMAGREDLRIEPKEFFEGNRHSGTDKPLILDHAYYWTSR